MPHIPLACPIRFASLGSGSQGNGWVFQHTDAGSNASCILLDCGFTLKETLARLQRLQLAPSDLAGIVTTHEHDDHASGVFRLGRKFNVPVYTTHGTWRASIRAGYAKPSDLESGWVNLIDSHMPFAVGAFEIQPFPVPHDAAEPIQVLIRCPSTGFTVGVLTDCGASTPHVVRMLNMADCLVLESNHCETLLAASMYPPSLKRRVGGAFGHLSNAAALGILNQMESGKLRHAVAAHLSQKTNCPDLVYKLWASVLQPKGVTFQIACQHDGTHWVHLEQGSMIKTEPKPFVVG